jgi:hypothetical protein
MAISRQAQAPMVCKRLMAQPSRVRGHWWQQPRAAGGEALAGALKVWNSSLANPLVNRGNHSLMTEQYPETRTKKTATEARAAVTGHNVRYVLAASMIGAVIFFAGLLYFWAA